MTILFLSLMITYVRCYRLLMINHIENIDGYEMDYLMLFL